VTLDGEDLADTLLGKARRGRTSAIFWRRPPDRPGSAAGDGKGEGDNPDLAAREGYWKYYENYDGGGRQLYDLRTDVAESEDVAARHPKVVERLHGAVARWSAGLPADAGDKTARQVRGR
jgi:uncharacterized sulfatase